MNIKITAKRLLKNKDYDKDCLCSKTEEYAFLNKCDDEILKLQNEINKIRNLKNGVFNHVKECMK